MRRQGRRVPSLEDLLDEIARRPPQGLQIERTPKGIIASTPAERTQKVRIVVRDDDVQLSAIAAPRSVVPETPKRRVPFLRRLWEINAHTDLVAFGLDGRGRVVGTCHHPLETLDREELELYLVALVRECDRLEWVLTAEDRF